MENNNFSNGDELKKLLIDSQLLGEVFQLKKETKKSKSVKCTVVKNNLRVRGFYAFEKNKELYVGIWFGPQTKELIESLSKLDSYADGKYNENRKEGYVNFKSNNFLMLFIELKNIFVKKIKDIMDDEYNNFRNKKSKFAGLINMREANIDIENNTLMGRTFTMEQIIYIWENESKNNLLKDKLLNNGIYLIRSHDGLVRYIGSAYGENGIIGRWMNHIGKGGDAKFLNFYISKHGFDSVVFTVLEVCNSSEHICIRENQWKSTLGTLNKGEYNGIQLNNN